MIEFFYTERRTLADFRRGPLGPVFDGFAAHLKKQRYSAHHARSILGLCCQFNYFLLDEGGSHASRIKRSKADAFIKAYLKGFRTTGFYHAEQAVRLALRHLFGYLVAEGIVRVEKRRPVRKRYDWMLDSYARFLREDRQVTEMTVERLRRTVADFLDGLGDRVSRAKMKALAAVDIEAYLKQHVKDSRENQRRQVGALRGFLHWCARNRITSTNLSGVIPSAPRYYLASLPKGMDDAAIEHMLEAIPQDTPVGCRNYAIVLLITAYGLRAQQLVRLRLDDINWPRSLIRIPPCKGGKEVVMPLVQSVGEAVLRYLRQRPQDTPHRQLILASRAPYGPVSGLAASQVVRGAMRKAGIRVPNSGAKTLRHSWAIRALTKGSPIKAIADVLGHRWIHNTFIYAKADLKTLREVALPWPGERR